MSPRISLSLARLKCASASLDALLQRAADSARTIQAAKANVAAKLAVITETRAAYLPSLSVTAPTGTSLVPGTLLARTNTRRP